MRVSVLTTVLAGALATTIITGAAAAPAPTKGGLCKVVCAPAPPQAKPQAKFVPPPPKPVRRVVRARHRARHYAASSDYYSYREAETVRDDWHGSWREAPNDAMIPGPPPYGPH